MLASPVRYYGAKSRALSTLYNFFPDDINDRIFVDLFGGSFVVSLNLHPRKAIINDLNDELVDFWMSIRGYDSWENHEELFNENPDGMYAQYFKEQVKEGYPLYKLFKEELKTCVISGRYMDYLKERYEATEDRQLKTAINGAYFYLRNRLSWSGSNNITVATIPSGQQLRDEFDLWHKWFVGKDVRIWKLDFTEVLKRVNKNKNKIFIYADPPYFEMGWGYKHDMLAEQHTQLAELLKASPHPWVLSYDDTPEIQRLYEGNRIERVQWTYSCAPGHKTDGKHELVITSERKESSSSNRSHSRGVFER